MIKYRSQAKEHSQENFMMNAGIDTMNDPAFLPNGKSIDLLNLDMLDNGPVARQGLSIVGGAENGKVWAEGVINVDGGDIRVRVFNTLFQKYSGTSWTTIKTVSQGRAILASYRCSDRTTAAVFTGTATTGSSSLILTVASGAMTINAYSGKVLRITSGTGAGQESLITSNDLTDIFVASRFDNIPDATSVFEVRETRSHIIFTNGIDIPFKYDGTTVTDLTGWKKYTSLDVIHDRIFAATRDIDYVYVSNMGTDYFHKENYIPVNENGDAITALGMSHEEMIVYKRNSRYRIIGYDLDALQLVTADEKVGCIAPASVAHGNNYNFFLGYGGVYSLQSLNNSSVDEGTPVSADITNLILAHPLAELEAAIGWIDSNRYHIAIGNEVFVYHIYQSLRVGAQVWTRYQYPDTISAALVHNGRVWLGGKQSYEILGGTDFGNIINCQIITGDKIMKDRTRTKLSHRDMLYTTPTDTDITVQVSTDAQAYETLGTWNAGIKGGEIRIIINRRHRRIRYKYTFPGTEQPEIYHQEQYYSYTQKFI